MMIVMIAYGVLICWKGMHSRMQLCSGQPGSRVARPQNASAGGGSAKAKHITVSLFRILHYFRLFNLFIHPKARS